MGRPVIKKIVNLDIVGVNGMFGRGGEREREEKNHEDFNEKLSCRFITAGAKNAEFLSHHAL